MTFLKKLFSKKENISDRIKAISHPLIIKTYRDLAKSKNCAPTFMTSDAEILSIYKVVLTEFKNASRQKGDELPATNINFIVFHFLNIYEQEGKAYFEDYLKTEIMNFQKNGLREIYKNRDIRFF